jgi:hypothetical protein
VSGTEKNPPKREEKQTMKKSMLAIAFVLATSLTFAQTAPANPPAGSTDSTKTKKHHKKAAKTPKTKAPASATPAAPATK